MKQMLDSLLDEVSSLLGDHDRWGVGIAADNCRHDGGVNNPQTFHPAHSQPGVHYRHRIAPHLAGAHRMILSFDNVADVFRYYLLALRLLAGQDLRAAVRIESFRPGDPPG